MSERDSIIAYIEARARRHRDKAKEKGKDASFHRGTAVLYDALAGDIRAGLDQA